MTASPHPLRPSAPEALDGRFLPDFDGRSADWSAVAFGDDVDRDAIPIERRVFLLGVLVIASIPYVFIGAAARWLVG